MVLYDRIQSDHFYKLLHVLEIFNLKDKLLHLVTRFQTPKNVGKTLTSHLLLGWSKTRAFRIKSVLFRSSLLYVQNLSKWKFRFGKE